MRAIPSTSVAMLYRTALLFCSLHASLHAAGFGLKANGTENVDLERDGVVLARFMTAHDTSTPTRKTDTYKPYLHVFDPSGAVRLTKGPGSVFPHHRGIFVGFNKIGFEGKNYDRWHMSGGDQVISKLLPFEITPDRAVLAAEVNWEGAAGAPLITEERRMTFTAAAKPFYLGVELESSLKPVRGEATIDGDPEHAGAQFRPSEKIDGTKTTYIFPGENVDAKKMRDIPWVAEIFTVEGKTFTALLLSDPANAKGAAFSAYRDYGRFGVFPKGVAKVDAPFKVHVQWLIAEGEVRDAAVLQKAWNTFAKKDEPTPVLTVRAAESKAAPKKPAEPKAQPAAQ